MEKKLILLGGPMGVGKTTIGQYLVEKKLTQAVFLDGDWCWHMHPWVFSDENKAMVMRNIQFLLNSFLANSQLETIVFAWVMHQQSIIDELLAGLTGDFTTTSFSLIPSEAELTARFTKDVAAGKRAAAGLPGSIDRIAMYQHVDSIKIKVTGQTCEETATQILNQLATIKN